MSSVAIELSRRGYVVMAVDPYTIGRSEIVNTPMWGPAQLWITSCP